MRKFVSFLAIVATVSIAGLSAEINSELHQLPVPTGTYQVGIKTFDLIDQERIEPAYPEGRLVPIWVYFPGNEGPQIPSPKLFEERALDTFDAIPVGKNLKIEVFGKQGNDLYLLKNTKKHPVIFLNHGDGCLLSDLAYIAEDLASHGYVVIAIQHQLKNDNEKFLRKYDRVIDNMLFVFDWLKKNNKKEFFNSLNLNHVGCIGYSMGANSVVLFGSKGYRHPSASLFPHENVENVKECIIAIDPQCFPFPVNNNYPTFLLFAEKREFEQKKSGEYDFMKRLGHEFIYYPYTHHGSFVDAAYFNIECPLAPEMGWFLGSTDERKEFFDHVRKDIRSFLQEHLKSDAISGSDQNSWKIGGKIHFEEQSSVDYVGTVEINELTRKTIKDYFDIQIDSCAHNAKALLKKENNQIILTHREERSKPGIGEEIHATLLYTSKRVENGHETLRDIYDNLVQVDASLPQDHAPAVEQVADAYQKIIKPDWKFQISDVEFISGKTGSGIVAKLRLDGRDEILNKEGNPISGDFLHLSLVMIDLSAISETDAINQFVLRLREKLSGKMIKVGNRNGHADLEFGISGSTDRIRPSFNEMPINGFEMKPDFGH